ncbi:sugar phosphate isomerase/epimerase family protein [Chitinophaga niabensis]|uniref:Sugar phosphate isomerase/epimerase n=1 Tax=Chitinophaga niabensis TaxID=536979 RepID=A0A1N6JX58_9BACT|nr:sugar phosphate isomerase/epimerase [Chitinophaga niabensis]SIO48922.1 Sugar phosphate isomerase/epimerase [Chitinophaga niabensis]
MTRREWSKLMLTGLAGFAIPFTGFSQPGVVIGLQTYSLRDRSLDEAIKAMVQLNIKSCELWEGHVEPLELQWKRNSTPEETSRKKELLTEWRNSLQMSYIESVRGKFSKAGIKVQAYSATIKDNISEHDLELAFRIAQALGTDTLTTSGTVSVMKRVDVYAQRYKINVGMHNHAHVDKPNEFATPDSFERGAKGLSEYIKINLDIGHFTAANFDAVAFIREHHQRIVCLHLKDRKKDQGANLPFGSGDTPIKEVLRLIRDNNWAIPANIEYEYNGADTVKELEKCIAYCQQIITA